MESVPGYKKWGYGIGAWLARDAERGKGRKYAKPASSVPTWREREFFIDKRSVRIHLIIEMI